MAGDCAGTEAQRTVISVGAGGRRRRTRRRPVATASRAAVAPGIRARSESLGRRSIAAYAAGVKLNLILTSRVTKGRVVSSRTDRTRCETFNVGETACGGAAGGGRCNGFDLCVGVGPGAVFSPSRAPRQSSSSSSTACSASSSSRARSPRNSSLAEAPKGVRSRRSPPGVVATVA